ncbi:PSMA2 isoform 5, partial [Pan troglodytes]
LSPSGKLVQIEYALAAVAGGAPSVGIKECLCTELEN